MNSLDLSPSWSLTSWLTFAARQITRVHLRNAKLVSAKKVRKDLYKGKRE